MLFFETEFSFLILNTTNYNFHLQNNSIFIVCQIPKFRYFFVENYHIMSQNPILPFC